jgi:hypothetical protein
MNSPKSPANRERMTESQLDRLLACARADVRRLRTTELVLATAAVTGLVLTSVRGLVATVAPPSVGRTLPLGVALGLGVVASLGFLAASARLRRELERRARDVYTLEFARDALDHEASPVVELHPYREREDAPPGRQRIIVRTGIESPPTPADTPRESRLRAAGRRGLAAVALIAAVVVFGLFVGGAAEPLNQRWTFLDASTSLAGLDLHASASQAGPWAVEDDEAATGARALVNREGDAGSRPATLVAQSLWIRDFAAMTRCKTAEAHATQQCGLLFRFRDAANYDVVRLDTIAKVVTLATVVGEEEAELARAPADATSNVWHELRVDASAGRIRVSWNSKPLIDVVERVTSASGRIGLWAPAAGVATFDELAIDPLADSPRGLEVLPLFARSRS